MVNARIAAATLAGTLLLWPTSGTAQRARVARSLSDCAAGQCFVVEAGTSFSNVRFEFNRGGQRIDEDTGAGVQAEADVVVTQPFKTTPFGPNVTSLGLGSVRSAQLNLALTQIPAYDPDAPEEAQPDAGFAAEILAAVSHRRMPSGDPATPGRRDRFGYAAGLGLSYFPGGKRLGAFFQYRRQYLPDAVNGSPVRVENAIVRGSIAGGLGGAPGFKNGINYDLSAAYDLNRKVPGVQIAVSTRVREHPFILLGLRSWAQGRDDDPRTRDKRWDVSPQLKVKF